MISVVAGMWKDFMTLYEYEYKRSAIPDSDKDATSIHFLSETDHIFKCINDYDTEICSFFTITEIILYRSFVTVTKEHISMKSPIRCIK